MEALQGELSGAERELARLGAATASTFDPAEQAALTAEKRSLEAKVH